MGLTPRLDSVEALVKKLEREHVRAFHHPHAVHKADHFYNFCITAQAMQDYVLEHLGKIDTNSRQPFKDAWDREQILVAVADIANSANHFQLQPPVPWLPRTPKTQQVRPGRTTVFEFYETEDGDIVRRKRSNVRTYVVILENGKSLELYAFMADVLNYWRSFLKDHGILLRRQPWKTLHGER